MSYRVPGPVCTQHDQPNLMTRNTTVIHKMCFLDLFRWVQQEQRRDHIKMKDSDSGLKVHPLACGTTLDNQM